MNNQHLIIHIGTPKTATTTLQEGLFVDLHSKNMINYLGKSLFADFKIDSFKEMKQQYDRIFNYVFMNQKFNNEENCFLKTNILNMMTS